MPTLSVFNNVSIDGYFVDAGGGMGWAHRGDDPEWNAYVSGNASGDGLLVFGRRTYDMMASYWPTPMAASANPVVAERMNAGRKLVFSRTMRDASWRNTRLVTDDLIGEMRRLKRDGDVDMTILGSGSIVAQLAEAGLIDTYQLVVVPIALGAGRTMFDGLTHPLNMKSTGARAFRNGSVVLSYEPVS